MKPLSISKSQSWLGWFFRGLIILGFVILVGRLIELQVIKGNYFKALANENRIRRIPITAKRGRIVARGGETLVGNNEIEKYIVFTAGGGIEKKDDNDEVPDAEVVTEYIRGYKLGEKFAHVSGYLGEVGEDEVGKINPNCPDKGPLKLGQIVGRSGLEEQYECILSGFDGEELVEVDTVGNRIRTLGVRDPIPGQDLRTHVDYNLQSKLSEIVAEAKDLPKDEKGAIVVTDTRGEVLALYSFPSFDPNIFIDKERSGEVFGVLRDDENMPFFNRAIGGLFHPGSVFKPVVSIAALEEGAIDKDYTFNDEGLITVKTQYGDFSYKNWFFTQYGGREGEIGLVKAIARSTDTFFYKTGELLGIDKLVDWSQRFGYNKPTGIDIPGELSGLVPSPDWKERTKGEIWFLGNTYHMSIGQGDLAVTPIEVNRTISAIASGKLCTSKLVGEPECEDLEVADENLDLVKQGMVEACNPGGTAFTFFEINGSEDSTTKKVACKTGTAETGLEDTSHAWFVFYGPAEEPQIVTTVLVEKGGSGSGIAGPIAREIYNYWFGIVKEDDGKEIN